MNRVNIESFKKFLSSGSAGGFIQIGCVILSLLIASTALGPGLAHFLEFKPSAGHYSPQFSALELINDGLMAIFFLMVGLEIKRELVEGELADTRKAMLPFFAALGGVAVPAFIYWFWNSGAETSVGWGIPIATDIAFALAIVSILGEKVPASLKIFLAALAIVDDILAILVIAIFYSDNLQIIYMSYALAVVLLLAALNRFRVMNVWFYIIPGVLLWYFIHHSGIHATIAGVLTAFALPTTKGAEESPLEQLEREIVKPVNFIILPLFAFANTNIALSGDMFSQIFSPMSLGILFGLCLGKPLGILAMSWLSVRLGLSVKPSGATWSQLLGIGILGGIGFTMSIFVAVLSFSNNDGFLSEAKFAILLGSVIAGAAGYLYLSSLSEKPGASFRELQPFIWLSEKWTGFLTRHRRAP